MNICIIPARGGSKRIPKKNIKDFYGKPIIEWTIQAIIKSNIFDKIILSSDDKEIIKIAKKLGVEAPFIRPKNISDDKSTTNQVMQHASTWLNNNNYIIENICCVYPTSPMLNPEDLIKANKEIKKNKWDYVFSAYESTIPFQRSFKKNIEGGVQMYFPKNFAIRTQDLPSTLLDAGQFYFGTKNAWENCKEIFSKKSHPLLIPESRVQDIDVDSDWINAEKKFQTFFNI
tara:strand:- start:989 stop:1678 length:690 start_codon:yes stop_codon:yes gene_type:complete